ncbi:MAG TPA: universal stress protein [Aestuariivirga sp.]|nr:universal stress protein [Aestuariivirga sp.]
MTYKTIMVSLNEIGRLPQLIEAAAFLGRTFKAHVSGLYVIPAVQVYPSVGFEAAPQVFEGNRTYFKENAEKVRAAFETAMKKEGLNFDLHVVDARTPVIADEMIAQGRSADVIVVSATNPDEITGVERDFVEQTIMASGRPVIVLPFKGETKLSLAEVVLGWEGGREAARAAFDAMPLLKAAKKVRIVRADPQKDPGLRGSVPGADLGETLARHGVKAETVGYPTEGQDAGQALMRCASDTGAGLIVMGAYGHSRLTEFIFGGATRYVLQRHDRPVMMSH